MVVEFLVKELNQYHQYVHLRGHLDDLDSSSVKPQVCGCVLCLFGFNQYSQNVLLQGH